MILPTEASWPLPTRRDTLRLARSLAQCLRPADLVVLTGELGAGKTFLVRAMCRALGLPERTRVTSPTFNLVHEIETSPPILHVDLYRLSDAKDIDQLGLLARRDEGYALLVEWGAPFVSQLGGDALTLTITVAPRTVVLASSGPRSHGMLAQLHESRKESGQFC